MHSITNCVRFPYTFSGKISVSIKNGNVSTPQLAANMANAKLPTGIQPKPSISIPNIWARVNAPKELSPMAVPIADATTKNWNQNEFHYFQT